MNRTKKFLCNAIFAVIYQIVVFIVGFITPRVMMSVYGSETNGLISSITQFISYFSLVEAGLAGASVFALYKPLAEKNDKAISAIVTATQRLYMQSGSVFGILLMGLAFLYPVFIKTNVLPVGQITVLVFVLGTSGILEFFTLGKYRAILTANQELYVISFASIIYQIVYASIIVVLAGKNWNIVLVRGIALSAVLVRSIILVLYSRKKYNYIDYKEKPDKKALNKRWDALYLQILGAVHSGAPVILATFFTTLKGVSVYSVYDMILSGIGGIVGIFTNGLSSAFGEIIASGEKELLIRIYNEFEFAYYSIMTAIYGIASVMLLPFVKIYTNGITDANYILPTLAGLFVVNGFLYYLKTPQGMLVISAGHYRETRLQTTIQGVIVIAVGGGLASQLGLYGILVGCILSNVYRCIDLMIYVPTKIVGTSPKDTLMCMIKASLGCVLIYVFGNCLLKETLTYYDWGIQAVKVSILAVSIVGIHGFVFEKKQMCALIKRINHLKR